MKISSLFIVSLDYLVPIEQVEKHLAAHREFLDRCYQENIFIVSGRKVPRTGGIILAKATSHSALEQRLNEDPFKVQGIAAYTITEFEPTSYCSSIRSLVEEQ